MTDEPAAADRVSLEDGAVSIVVAADGWNDLVRVHQRGLWGLAYRMTGCAADADDIVQATFARAVERGAPVGDGSWKPWLTRVAVNLSIDILRRRRRQAYTGSWLPSPIETAEAAVPIEDESPEGRYARLETISFAFLLALEALTPRQRAVLLLRDVFDYSAREVGEALAMSDANVRITHHRARRAMRQYDVARCIPTRALQERTATALAEFVRCLLAQDMGGIEALLADGVRTVTDGAGEFTALHAPLTGADRVALLYLRSSQHRAAGGINAKLRLLNGLAAMVIEYGVTERRQAPRAVLRCEVDESGRITEIHAVLATRKLTAVSFGADSEQPLTAL
jgi:RNA polymerase sigma-70 factor (ECF subfamily)